MLLGAESSGIEGEGREGRRRCDATDSSVCVILSISHIDIDCISDRHIIAILPYLMYIGYCSLQAYFLGARS